MDALLDTPLAALVWYVGLLDRIPDFGRAMLAGLLLVLLLRLSRRKVPLRDVQFSISFWKISLLALVVTPLVVWLLPASRLTVFVDRLDPLPQPAGLAWLAVLGVWGAGTLIGLANLVRGHGRARSAIRALPTVGENHPLNERLRHWQRRLGTPTMTHLALSAAGPPSQLAGVPRVVLPRAVIHWPATATDLLIIHGLCRRLKHHGGWHLFAQAVACCYWPLPWVRTLGEGLLRDFHVTADNLAAACYQDELGYHRALRQIQQRLGTVHGAARGDAGHPQTGNPGRRLAAATTCVEHLRAVFRPRPGLCWDADVLADAHDSRRSAVWSEPGEQLALLIGQSLLVAMVVSGVTLREVPPEIERDYSITLDPTWMNTAFPDRSRFSAPPAAKPREAPEPRQEP